MACSRINFNFTFTLLHQITSFIANATTDAVRMLPTKLPEALTLLTYMEEMPFSNISWQIVYPD
jgi:hypothetical protein